MHGNWIKVASRWCWTAGLRSRIAGERTRNAHLQEVKLRRVLNLRTLHRLQQHPIGSLSSIVDERRPHMFPRRANLCNREVLRQKLKVKDKREKKNENTKPSAQRAQFVFSSRTDSTYPCPRTSIRETLRDKKRKKKVFLLRFVINDKWLQLQFRAGVNVPTAEIVENFN